MKDSPPDNAGRKIPGGRLRFTNGTFVSEELQRQAYKKGRRWYLTLAEGDVCEVLTAHELSQRRLKFTDGTFVPDDLQTQSYEMDNKRYVTTVDGNECEVLTASLFSQRQHRARNRAATSMPVQSPELLSESSAADTITGIVERLQDDLDPYGGVSHKYLKERVARLPSLAHVSELGQEAFSRDEAFREHLALVRLGSRPLGAVFDVYSIPIELDDAHGTRVRMRLHTCCPDLTRADKPVFIFSGRKTDAYVPEVTHPGEAVRTILVGPSSDVALLREHLQPGLDYLEIEVLASATHGHYENLGLLNSRRIAAFCCALYFKTQYGIERAMMSDDNLSGLYLNAEIGAGASWGFCFDAIADALASEHSACVSLATISANGIQQQGPGVLGSKLYLFDMNAMHQRLGDEVSSWFLPFFPAAANAFWGEDYYFQLMFRAIFRGERAGYAVLPPERYGVTRAALPGLCRRVVRTADALCATDFSALFGDGALLLGDLEGLDFSAEPSIEESIRTLQVIINGNIEGHERVLNRSRSMPLMAAHAWANKLECKRTVETAAIGDDVFLSALEAKIAAIESRPDLHGYQRRILSEVRLYLGAQCTTGQFNMATGTGKTYIQIYLAIAALLTGTRRPIVIVTPYRQLVEQAFRDFMSVLSGFDELPIQAAQIIKVDSAVASVSVQALMQNRTLDNQGCVMIFCQDSYAQVLASEDAAMQHYQRPCMVLIDESHLQSTLWTEVMLANQGAENCFIARLSATPGAIAESSRLHFSINYLREQAVADGYLTPCILDTFNADYSAANVTRVITALPDVLRQTMMPTGEWLIEKKGIIYVPNTSGGNDYSHRLKQALDAADIPCFEINSNEPDSLRNLQAYKDYHAHPSAAKILICKGMAKVGFSDKETHWVIYLQHGDAASFCQSAGRAMRLLNSEKVAYIMAFRDVDATLLFKDRRFTADAQALARCSEDYKMRREENQGCLAILADAQPSLSLAHFGLFSTDMTPRGQNSPAREDVLVDDTESIEQEIDFLERGLERYQGREFPHGRLRLVIDEIHKIPSIDTQCKLFRKLLDNVFPYLLPFHTRMYEVVDNLRGYISDANRGSLAAGDRPGW